MKTPFVNIHTHSVNDIDNENLIEIRNIDVDGIADIDVPYFYSIGLHPWNIAESGDDDLYMEKMQGFMRDNAGNGNLLAIGECGIDRAVAIDFEMQKDIFMRHVEMSERYGKPLIIHSVRSYPDVISVKKTMQPAMPWIIHGFQGNEHSARQLLSHGICLSLGGILFRDERRAASLLEMIPKERLFLETDDSGRSIVEVYERTSRMTSIDIDELKTHVFDNFIEIFGSI